MTQVADELKVAMNFQQLRFVVSLADTKSFTKAAEQCNVTQPALSNAIGQFEEELGGKLFDRNTRSVVLTKFGESLIQEMRQLCDARRQLLIHAAEYHARDDLTVRFGISPLISNDFVTAMLGRIEKEDAGLNIILSEMNKEDIGLALMNGELDFGLIPAPAVPDMLRSKKIYSEPLLCLSDTKAGNDRKPVPINTLEDEQILMVGNACGLATAVRELFQNNQVALAEYEGRALSYSILEKWAQLGIGITLLPASKVMDLTNAQALADLQGNSVSIQFHACWKPNQEVRPVFTKVLTGLTIDQRDQ